MRRSASVAGACESFSGRRTLSRTLAHGISVGSWNTKPMGCRPSAFVGAMGNVHGACARRAEPRDQPQRGRLAAAGRPEQRDELAVADIEIERPERGHAVVIDLGDAAQTHGEARRVDIRPGQSGLGHLASVLRPQIEADALVDEAQRVGLAVIDVAANHAGAHHLVEEARHPRVASWRRCRPSGCRRNRRCRIPSSWRRNRRATRRSFPD